MLPVVVDGRSDRPAAHAPEATNARHLRRLQTAAFSFSMAIRRSESKACPTRRYCAWSSSGFCDDRAACKHTDLDRCRRH
jgi:hypothetical protein